MVQGTVCSIWLSSTLMLILLILCTISVMVTPTESSSDFTPLVRPRPENHSSNGNESSISDADVQKRIQEVFNRKGYSNPDPSPNDSQEAQPEVVAVRIASQPTRRRKRPLWKIDENFDPRKSYVIKHPNGTITYVPPKDLDISGTVATGTTTTPSSTVTNVLIDKMSEASSRFVFPNDLEPRIDKTECTPEFPVCSNVFDYPHELINDIVGRQKDRYAEVFGNDVVVESGDKLVQRFDNVDEDGNAFEYICDSEERLIHPKSGFTTDNTSVMIINTKDYMQGVRIETCRRRGEPCEKLSPLFARTECKQVYHYRTLLAIDPKTNQPYKEKFKLPSCCKCVIVPLDGSAYRKKRETDGL
ncbi:uncharacterized protein spz isoform X2 [Ochlerotatus camptorhynchus]|uniref:uncharacterized protein spz isoform X2 n=1 Tax=Ochlerotatus camptorhynchus TaxID=644619 RepID=UPI0031D1F77B